MKTQLLNILFFYRRLRYYQILRRLYLFKRDQRIAMRRQLACKHVVSKSVEIVGEYGPAIPHPHPLFAEKLKVQIQPIAQVCVCFKCNGVFPLFMYNQKDAEAELPLFDKHEPGTKESKIVNFSD